VAVLGPLPSASAAPAADAGAGTVVADLGLVKGSLQPGFSSDGAYYAYLVAAGDACDFRVWDVGARRQVTLANTHVVCDERLVSWAARADTLVWQVAAATPGEVTEYTWDAGSGSTSVLAPDANVLYSAQEGLQPAVSADGRFLFFVGRSASHPAPPVDEPEWSGYVYDRSTGVSLPLSKPGVHVQFATWGPAGHTFVAAANGGNDIYGGPDGCFGSGTSCRVVPDVYVTLRGAQWAADGKAVIADPSDDGGPLVYDFSDSSATRAPTGHVDRIQFARLFGAGGRRVLLAAYKGGSGVWDRTTGKVTSIPWFGSAYPSPTGRYLLSGDWSNGTFRTFEVDGGGDARYSTFYGTTGYWTPDESAFLGTGPGGCSSLRQWSPSANTVSLFGPPAPHSCFGVPTPDVVTALASASGRFGLVEQVRDATRSLYVADLRRHVLLGPFRGGLEDEGFAPGGADVFALRQPSGDLDSDRVLLVDPTPTPDVDDKPRWTAASPANGAQLDLTVGRQGRLTFGASDPQQTPVTLFFRWRAKAGYPVATPTPGWSCVQRRLAGGATQADCTFAPTAKHREVRYVDVWARNDVTGAQSDTRSYLVASTPAGTRLAKGGRS
jgi:hypothetical protein